MNMNFCSMHLLCIRYSSQLSNHVLSTIDPYYVFDYAMPFHSLIVSLLLQYQSQPYQGVYPQGAQPV